MILGVQVVEVYSYGSTETDYAILFSRDFDRRGNHAELSTGTTTYQLLSLRRRARNFIRDRGVVFGGDSKLTH